MGTARVPDFVVLCCVVSGVCVSSAGAQTGAEATPAVREPQSVELPVYIGWRAFQEFCARCHGAHAEGSGFAPALGPRIAHMTAADFEDAMLSGYPGLERRMPAWGENPELRQYTGALWAYLTARADERLRPGSLTPARGRAE